MMFTEARPPPTWQVPSTRLLQVSLELARGLFEHGAKFTSSFEVKKVNAPLGSFLHNIINGFTVKGPLWTAATFKDNVATMALEDGVSIYVIEKVIYEMATSNPGVTSAVVGGPGRCLEYFGVPI